MAQHELVAAGFGGQGIMMLGKLFAEAGVLEGNYATFLPSYGPAMRGGTANCAIVISDEPIASPVLPHPKVCVVMNLPSLKTFEPLVAPGGILIVNSSLIKEKTKRTDIKTIYVPANEIAEKAGMVKAANIVILGIVVKATGAVKVESTKEAIKQTLGEAKAKYLPINLQVLDAGLNFDING
jgi:2-oxoglutarate ferredoxin oxidoreductase subunit gamma